MRFAVFLRVGVERPSAHARCLAGARAQTMRPFSMTISETCKWSGIGRTKLYELIAANKVKAVKLGSRTLIIAESMERFLADLPPVTVANDSSADHD